MGKHNIKLSVTIITYNEENNIARCLESVATVADEIVVVDSFSVDRTKEITAKYPVRFIEHPFEGYVEQKNYALAMATYPHVLSLDADEALSETLITEILRIKSDWKYDGYYINRLSNYCGKWIRHGAWHPDYKIRLFIRDKGKWCGYNPHDHIIMAKHTKTARLKGKLLHYSYHSINQHISKLNQYSGIQAAEYYRHGILPGGGKIFFHSFWRFFRDYFVKGGFLDGFYGLVIAVNSGHEAFLKYVKLKTLYKKARTSENKRVLVINTIQFWGGGEKWNFDITRYLNDKGYNLFFVVSRKGALEQRLLTARIPVFKLSPVLKGYLNPVQWIKIQRLIRYFKPNTVICSLSNDLKMIGPLAKLNGIKSIIFRRGIAVPVSNTIINRYLYRSVITNIVAVSSEARRNILFHNHRLIPERKINIIYNGINIDLFLKRKGNSLYERKNQKELILGNAGRLSGEKDQFKFIDIARLLKKHKIPFKILIAGEGELYSKLMQQIRKNKLNNEIKLLGFVEKMEDFYASIDIFVLTSKHEGFGYVLLEAGISQLPVVTFDIGSSSEILVEGETGFLAVPGDIKQLTDRIVELYRNPPLREKMGKNAAERVKEVFDQQKSFESFTGLLK